MAGWVLAGLAGCNTAPQKALTPKQKQAMIEQATERETAMLDAAKFTVSAYTVTEVDVPPRPVKRVAPIYPFGYQETGTGGVAWIAFIVDTDGTVKQAQVARASDMKFGEAALAAVKQWRYKPALKNGVPVRVRMVLPMIFTVGE